jgi:hypothetical protein
MRKWTNKPSVTSDGLSPMVRLLRQVDARGRVCVDYDQQWRTFFKAQELGYIDEDGRLTQAGIDYSGRA